MKASAIAIASALTASMTTFGLNQALTSGNPAEVVSVATAESSEVRACANRQTGQLRLLTKGKCKKRERLVTWAKVGPAGPPGPPGTFPGFDDDDDVSQPPNTAPSPFGSNTGRATSGYGSDCTMGTVILTAANFGPGIPANGQLLNIKENQALFSLLGWNFGGDRATTFALPDLRSAAPNGMTYMICDEGTYPVRR